MLRIQSFIIVVCIVSGCLSSSERSHYDPQTFRADVEKFIHAKQYRQAVTLVKIADVERQLDADGTGYIAIGGFSIFLPGVAASIQMNAERDWHFPGTSDVIPDSDWQATAYSFAKCYNLKRQDLGLRMTTISDVPASR